MPLVNSRAGQYWNLCIVTIYHGKKYHGITIYLIFLKLCNGVHYSSGYIYSYTLHEVATVYIQTFYNQL